MDSQIEDLQPLYSSDEEEESLGPVPSIEPCRSKGSSFKEYMFNLKYNLLHSSLMPIAGLQRRAIELGPESEPAYLLGNSYSSTQIEEFHRHFRSTIWMSYRAAGSESDAGWGCTIRAVQMVLAEVIKRNNPTIELSAVVNLFREGPSHPFSLQKICQRGNIKARWTGFNEVASIMISLLKEESRKPRPVNINISTQLYYGALTIHSKNKLIAEENSFPKLVVISNKIDNGNEMLNSEHLPHLRHCMKMSSFCGMVGGTSGEALYIVGFQDDRAIVLDPHYVQEAEGKMEEVFFKKTPRGIPFNRLCSSISVCFFFRNANEYQLWSGEMCYAQRIYSPCVINDIFAEDSNEQVEQYRKRSEDFEIL